jgi:hypothetical protein
MALLKIPLEQALPRSRVHASLEEGSVPFEGVRPPRAGSAPLKGPPRPRPRSASLEGALTRMRLPPYTGHLTP